MNNFPFEQKKLSEGVLLRKFSSDTQEGSLVWHRDRQDRVVEVVHGNGWMFQRDDSVPVLLTAGSTFEIQAEEWHRIIKGKGDLIVKIMESNKKKLSKKQKKIARAAPPPDEITAADFKALNKSVEEATKPSDNKQYAKGRSEKDKKKLDKAVAAYNKAKETPEKADDLAAIKRRDAVAEGDITDIKSSKILSESQLKIMINDIVEEIKLDSLLNEIEDRINEKKKKKKKSSGGKLSKAVKKSLNKKADKRCLTRGSVYAEFRAGLGAFYTSGSRKGMSAHQWAHARVNSANPSKKWAKVKKRKKCPKKKK
jgi:hypothetical protein